MFSRNFIRSRNFLGLSYSLRKTCPYSELFWSIFSRIRTEYGEMRSISPYSVRMRENTDQNNSEYGPFLRSDFSVWSYSHTRAYSYILGCVIIASQSIKLSNDENISEKTFFLTPAKHNDDTRVFHIRSTISRTMKLIVSYLCSKNLFNLLVIPVIYLKIASRRQ